MLNGNSNRSRKFHTDISKTSSKIALTVITAAGGALRLYRWLSYSYWYDEITWVYIYLVSGFRELYNYSLYLAKPPLFGFLLYYWQFLGQDEFTARLLPVILGVLLIFSVYRIGVLLYSRKVGVAAALLTAVSPMHIYYSQDLSNYTLLALLLSCSFYYFFLFLKSNNISSIIKFVIFSTLSLYTHYPAVFFLITLNIFFLFNRKNSGSLAGKWVIGQFSILLLYTPWLLKLPRQFELIDEFFAEMLAWVPRGNPFHFIHALRVFAVGFNASYYAFLLITAILFYLLPKGFMTGLRLNGKKSLLLTLWVLMPIFLSVMFSPLYNTFTYRNFIPVLPAYYIILALNTVKLKKHMLVPFFLLLAVIGFSLHRYYNNILTYPESFYYRLVVPRKNNRQATEYILNNFRNGDMVAHTCDSTAVPYVYYSNIYFSDTVYPHRLFHSANEYWILDKEPALEFIEKINSFRFSLPEFKNKIEAIRFIRRINADFDLDIKDIASLNNLISERNLADMLQHEKIPDREPGAENDIKEENLKRLNRALLENIYPDLAPLYPKKRLWLVFSSWDPAQLKRDPGYLEWNTKKILDDNFNALGYKNFEGIRIYLYRISCDDTPKDMKMLE